MQILWGKGKNESQSKAKAPNKSLQPDSQKRRGFCKEHKTRAPFACPLSFAVGHTKKRRIMGRSLGKINLDDISISPKYRVSDWENARNKNDWSLMVDIFTDRIEGRYLKPIRLIEKDDDISEFSGFAILALDCLIIETLNQFYKGMDETVGEHRLAFWEFFKKSEFFKESFSRKKAFVFYSHFRCGILHQAQTKNKSLVRIECEKMIEPISSHLSYGLIVDREKFHDALESEIKSYKEKLESCGDEWDSLRKNFIIKMNIICGLNEN